MEPIPVDLSGVPETLLWNLGRRAAAARIGASLLEDPLAIEVAGRLQYDFADTSRGARWHAVRVATFDDAVRRFLDQHPAGTMVALGEGLETQFWRPKAHSRADISVTGHRRRLPLRSAEPHLEDWVIPLTAVSAAALAAPYGVTGSGRRVSS